MKALDQSGALGGVPDRSERIRKTASAVADALAILAAVSLPWSTSATSILVALWLLALLPALDWPDFRRECQTWHGGMPLLLFGLALLSVIWADASVYHRFDALRPLLKLIAIPFLIVQFQASGNGRLAIGAYLASCTVLLVASLVSIAFPIAALRLGFKYPGMAVKDYISQSAEFATCAFALLLWVAAAWSRRRYRLMLFLAVWAALFLGDIFFVATSRTELLVVAVLVALMFYRWLGWKGVPLGLGLAASVFALTWVTSPYLRFRINHATWEVQQYFQHDRLTSAGLRLEWWRKSLDIVRAAPLIGHGMGTTKALFTAEATGTSGAAAALTDNPHNQILAIAIELGLIGVAALLAMWFAHFRLFQASGGLPWLGTIVVVQNVVGSLFNSHIYDFTPGWTYVFGVGILGGMALRQTLKAKMHELNIGGVAPEAQRPAPDASHRRAAERFEARAPRLVGLNVIERVLAIGAKRRACDRRYYFIRGVRVRSRTLA